ncbi:MAG: NAD(P)/FAD-dependent oxidoreductase [Saprospiraceae bacterium]
MAIKTDILIIGAGPVGLFTVFEAGLLKLRCHLVDALPQTGGQLSEIYPKKPIYDIPGFPSILAGDLVKNLEEQIAPFNPTYSLGQRAETIDKLEDGTFRCTTSRGEVIEAPVIAIAGGLGSFEPRKPPLENIAHFEDKGVDYIIRDPEVYRGKDILIAGGGDSALDWTIFLAEVANSVSLIHRRTSFRGALDSVEKVHDLAAAGRINLITEAQAIGLEGGDHLTGVKIKSKADGESVIPVDNFIPLFGLSPKLGPLANWGLDVEKNAIKVDTLDYSTNIPGIYAIGDINTYEGKLKLILCGFHEGTIMVQSAFKRIYPDQKLSFKYTTVQGAPQGFEA